MSDFVPVTSEVYRRLLVRVNDSLWPAHIIALAVGSLIVCLAGTRALRGAWILMSGAWMFIGYNFHIVHYSDLNWAAWWFGVAFIFQGFVMLAFALWVPLRGVSPTGTAVILFGLIVYPLLSLIWGGEPKAAELFGITPEPTVIVSLGLLLPGANREWCLWIVPLGFGVVTGATAWVLQDPGGLITLLVAAAAAVLWLRSKAGLT